VRVALATVGTTGNITPGRCGSWRPLNGGLTVMTVLLGGARFVDGVYVPTPQEVSAA